MEDIQAGEFSQDGCWFKGVGQWTIFKNLVRFDQIVSSLALR